MRSSAENHRIDECPPLNGSSKMPVIIARMHGVQGLIGSLARLGIVGGGVSLRMPDASPGRASRPVDMALCVLRIGRGRPPVT